MRIRQIQVTNYRPFKEQRTFDFPEQFTVIAGVNGRGKTAILDALALTISRLLPQFTEAYPTYRHLSHSDIHHGEKSIRFDLKANCGGYPVDAFDVTYDTDQQRTRHKKLPRRVRDEIRNLYGKDKSKSDDAAPIAVYYTTDRASFRRSKVLPKAVPRNQMAAYTGALSNLTVNYRDFMARLRKEIELEDESRTENPAYFGPPIVASITNVLGKFVGEFTNLRVETRPLRLMVDKVGIPLDLGQLSDGERSFLAMITDLSRRLVLANPKLSNPMDGEGVVLIDELELHLHPKWQREVVDKLRTAFPNIQFICTTHSPFILHALRKPELIILDDTLLGDFENRGLEEIVAKVMGIADPNITPRYLKMLEAARSYFTLLLEARNPQVHREVNTEYMRQLKEELDRLTIPYHENPAHQAYLEMYRAAITGETVPNEAS